MRALTLGLLLVLGCVGGGQYGVNPQKVETLDVEAEYTNHGYFHDVEVKVQYEGSPLSGCVEREIVLKSRGYMAPRQVPSWVRMTDYHCDGTWDRFRFRDQVERQRFRGARLNAKLRDDADFIYYAVLTSYIWSDNPSEGVR